MNQSLLDPFQRFELPQTIEEVLRDGQTKVITFNRRGTLLAAGSDDGELQLYDFETRGVAKSLKPHSMRVTSIAWSKNGRFLASGSADKSVVLLDVEHGKEVARTVQPVTVTRVSLSPRNDRACVVSCATGPAHIVNFSTQTHTPVPYFTSDGEGKNAKASSGGVIMAEAVFDSTGTMLIVSQARGLVSVLDASSLQYLDLIKVPGHARICNLTLDCKGTGLLGNCADRVVRLYQVRQRPPSSCVGMSPQELRARLATSKAPPEGSLLHGKEGLLQLKREFTNAIERTPWRMAAFTGNGEHVSAASAAGHEHLVYIWTRDWGALEVVLAGPKEGIADMAWHPTRSILATVSSTGCIYIWARVYRENWAAFAPDFEELQDNYEYVEQEDEFDIQEADDDAERCDGMKEADADVDIDGLDGGNDPSSGEDDSTSLHHLPVNIEPDNAPISTLPHAESEAQPAEAGAADGKEDDVQQLSLSGNSAEQGQAVAEQRRSTSLGAEDAAGGGPRGAKGRPRQSSESQVDDIGDGSMHADLKRQKHSED